MKLEQHRLFERNTLTLTEKELIITTQNLITGKREWSVRLDEVSLQHNTRDIGVFSNGCLLSVVAIVTCSALMSLLSVTTTVIIIFISVTPIILGRMANYTNYTQINTTRGYIAVSISRRNKEQAEEFLAALKDASKKYLCWKYGTVDPDLSFERQIENYWWLRNNAIISDEEYRQLKEQLKAAQKK